MTSSIQVALVRPGPIQGGAVHPFIHNRQQLRVSPEFVPPYDHPLLEEPLRETLGVVVFQEQVLAVAIAWGGFSVGEAEGLRRAMSRKRRKGGGRGVPRALRRGRARARGRPADGGGGLLES